MNYPVWHLDFAGGGLPIAIMAIIHVYIAHFAVGGGLFLVLTEHKGLRDKSPAILDYVKKHTKFFLLLTMVLGSLTGVGIWFTISVLNPAATSVMIHTFVFAWGVEWLFFVAEIVSLFIYYYTFDKLDSRTHLMIGWIYFGAAWMSLFVINGIIDFMLTPGNWTANSSFWSAFFNPTFWPALFFRTFLAIMIAGLFGFVTASALKDEKLRISMQRFSASWLLVPFILFIGSAWWYRAALPPHVEELIFQRMPAMKPFISSFVVFSPLLILGGLLMAIKIPSGVSRSLAGLMLVIGLLYMGTFEFIREGGRRPYIIYDHMYSTAMFKDDVAKARTNGILESAKWVDRKALATADTSRRGQEVFRLLCVSCHSIDGPLNDIKKIAANLTRADLELATTLMGKQLAFMPPFAGSQAEKDDVLYYIHRTLLNKPE
ncbi:MAG: cytochrome ubiquinol oxidase subunit I [Desulfobulbaceae bacterium]|nr:cytochrome ubiquinol oxidase subunit I [Desulfobulbaceae bacterium]